MKNNDYEDPAYALTYLAEADSIPFRAEGEAVLKSMIPSSVNRVFDLGTGNGRLIALLLAYCPNASFVGVDSSPTMLEAAHARFDNHPRVAFRAHDLYDAIAPLGPFDAVVSSFAIHHCSDDRKRSLYAEIYDCLSPGGVFYNLEHVAPASEALHQMFLDALGITPDQEDPGNILLDVETQVGWLKEIGFSDVDCHWKWLELSLFGGVKRR